MSGVTAAAAILALWLAPAMAWAHAGAFILAKCSTDVTGTVSLELTVDCLQHPSLTEKPEAIAALRGILAVHTPSGSVALDALATAVLETTAVPDPDIPLPADPLEVGRIHTLVKMRYVWQPGVPEICFTVPGGNPHDVLFWLAGTARPAGGPVPWRILIAGDISPPVPVPERPDSMDRRQRLLLAAVVILGLVMMVWHRRARLL